MKTLILTEKPSVARDFAKALGLGGKKEGYFEDSRYIVTWAVGHLVTLFEPQDYDGKWKKWSFDTLPVIPEVYRYKPMTRTKKQLTIIRRIAGRQDICKIVIATDAGREGEVIARTVLLAVGASRQKPLFRFWTSQALTPTVIKSAMASLKPASAYDRLWDAGRARQIADWLVGMNGSRAATIKMKDMFSVGRVQTAVLAMLVERAKIREGFISEPYWLVKASFTNEKGQWQGLWTRDRNSRFKSRNEAMALVARIENNSGQVVSVKKEKKRKSPPLLYSLTDLQQDANIRFGFSATNTLSIAQGLYEKKKCLSYPRTDSKVLGSQNVSMIRNLAEKLSGHYSQVFSGMDRSLITVSNTRVFNDKKLSDHHALIPLAPLPKNSSEAEEKIYSLVLERFAAAFYPDFLFEQTEIMTAVVDNDFFLTRGRVTILQGWQALLVTQVAGKKEGAMENIPPLAKGDPARVVKTDVEDKKTVPPPLYTEALLLKDMTNPGSYVEEDQLKKIFRGDAGLGTQATRAQIIETLLKRSYVIREKKHLIPTEKGRVLIETLNRFSVASTLASPVETAKWEMDLSAISAGQAPAEAFIQRIEGFVRSTVAEFRGAQVEAVPEQIVGRCPQCGKDVVEKFKGFACTASKKSDGGCTFMLWKKIAGRRISPREAAWLLKAGKAGPFKGFVSKKKKRFQASLKLVEEDGRIRAAFDFDEPQNSRKKTSTPVRGSVPKASSPVKVTDKDDLGSCPVCGGKMMKGRVDFGCSNWKQENGGCRFIVRHDVNGKKLTPANINTLVSGKITRQYVFKDENGKKFKGRLKLEQDASKKWETVIIDREYD